MKKLFLSIVLSVLMLPALCMAQAASNMKALAIDQLYEYGQALYQRGDYPQAAVIFTRILAMDPNKKGAVDIARALNSKGQTITIPAQSEIVMPVVATQVENTVKDNNFGNIFQGRTVETRTTVATNPVVTNEVFKPINESVPSAYHPMVEVTGTNRDLKQDMQDTEQSIEQLKKDIAQLRTQIATGQEELANSKRENLLK